MVTSLSAADKRSLLDRRLKESADQKLFHRGFEEQAAQSPDAIAVVHGEQAVTYQALNTRANRLARRLRALGAGPEMLAGLCVERSVEMAVGLLCILKSGDAYVPLDPGFPHDRVAMMLADAGVAVLITQDRLRESLPDHEAFVVSIDAIERNSDGAVEPNLSDSAAVDNLAYVIYTSGSTGKPKGAAITHGSPSNSLASMRALFPMGAGDTLLAVTTLSFDIAALELYLSLVQGARVEIAGRELAIDGKSLALRLEQSDVTFCQATPSTWRMLETTGWAGAPGLTILCGGESLPRDLADRLIDKGKALWNLYGPTETTIWSSAGQVSSGEAPIAQTQLHAVDGRLQLVPLGVGGELYIGGARVARGYLNRPDLTAERFVPDPFSKVPGARLYRTGDRVRLRSDGTYECLGRLDHQAKIRGFRIELGEVETVLRRHPLVRDAVVVSREGSSGSMELVAYVVSQDGQKLGDADPRRHLLESLPEYMVPSSFMTLASLPMTPNGKIDRQGLPEPGLDDAAAAQAYLPPRGPIEEGIAQLWSELLGRPRVGMEDNLFEIGGHSLLATQIPARIRDLYGVEASLRDFLERPTVTWLLQRVEHQMREGAGLRTPPIMSVPCTGSAPASFAQQRLWFLDQLDPDSPVCNMPVEVSLVGAGRRRFAPRLERDRPPARGSAHDVCCGRRPSQAGDRSAPGDRTAACRLIRARGTVTPVRGAAVDGSGGETAVQHCKWPAHSGGLAAAWRLGASRRGHDAPHRRRRLVLRRLDSRSIGPVRGILTRVAISPARARLSICRLRRLAGALAGRNRADEATELLDRAAAGSARAGSAHGSPSSARPERPGLALHTRIEPEDAGRNPGAQLARERDTVHDAHGGLSGAPRSLLGPARLRGRHADCRPHAFRDREPSRALCKHARAARRSFGNPDFMTLLRRVRENALGAYTHQDLPFEQVVAVLQPQRDPARSPLFQVLFAMHNVPLPTFESTELSMTPLEPDTGTAKFDLALFATEKPQGFKLEIQYSTDLFDAATIDQMLEHLRTLLEGAVARPNQPISSLPLLSEAERQDLLGDGAFACTDLDGLTDDEVDELLTRLESETDVSVRSN
jgi:amino acid adenylation domain-containing protein